MGFLASNLSIRSARLHGQPIHGRSSYVLARRSPSAIRWSPAGRTHAHTDAHASHILSTQTHHGPHLPTRPLHANSLLKLRSYGTVKKGKGSPYSITERKVPELIPVLGSQPASDVSHKPGHYFSPGLQLPLQTLRGLLPFCSAW